MRFLWILLLAPPPGAGCPHRWDPICGCDLATYPNACEASLDHVSLLYFGECRPCRATGLPRESTHLPGDPAPGTAWLLQTRCAPREVAAFCP